MDYMKQLCVIAFIALLTACSSPQDKASEAQEDAYKAQENVADQRLELVNKYQTCVKDAGQDKQKIEACDSYLKEAQALN
jgi:outer membrane biogenesis lipoprotein LolB